MLFYFLVIVVYCFLNDREVEVVKLEWLNVLVVIRYVEFIGIVDNGMLDCFIFGIFEYWWEFINKVSVGLFFELISFVLDD